MPTWNATRASVHSSPAVDTIMQQGQNLFAFGVIVLGLEYLAFARLRGAIVPVIPWPPGYPAFAYLMGIVLLICSCGMFLKRGARFMTVTLGTIFLLGAVVLQVPNVFDHPLDLVVRTRFFEPLAIGASAIFFAGKFPLGSQSHLYKQQIPWFFTSGRYLFALSLLAFGIDHFLILKFIATLIPWWIPGSGMFWAWFTGAALVAAGISIATGWLVRWAGFLLGAMFGLWFLLLHLPRVLGIVWLSKVPKAPHDPNEWSSAFIALVLCGGSWMVTQAIISFRNGKLDSSEKSFDRATVLVGSKES